MLDLKLLNQELGHLEIDPAKDYFGIRRFLQDSWWNLVTFLFFVVLHFVQGIVRGQKFPKPGRSRRSPQNFFWSRKFSKKFDVAVDVITKQGSSILLKSL